MRTVLDALEEEEFHARRTTREALLTKWERGWNVLFAALGDLMDANLSIPPGQSEAYDRKPTKEKPHHARRGDGPVRQAHRNSDTRRNPHHETS